MVKVKIINDEYEQSSPTEGKLYITEEDRIIMSFNVGKHALTGIYLDTGLLVTIGISMVSPVPSTWKIELSND